MNFLTLKSALATMFLMALASCAHPYESARTAVVTAAAFEKQSQEMVEKISDGVETIAKNQAQGASEETKAKLREDIKNFRAKVDYVRQLIMDFHAVYSLLPQAIELANFGSKSKADVGDILTRMFDLAEKVANATRTLSREDR